MNSQQELLDAINTISGNKDKSFDTPATVLRVDGDTVWVHIDGGADETPVQKTINCIQGDTVQVRISSGSAFLVGNASAPPTDDAVANVAHFVAEQAEIEAIKALGTAKEAKGKADDAQETAEQAMTAAAQSLTTYETWYLLSATAPTQPTEQSHSGWSTTEPAWSSSSTDTLYFSIRTVKGNGTATWSAVGTVQSYADLQILKNAIISTVQSNYVGQGFSGITSLSSTMLQNSNGVNIFNGTLAVGDSYAHIDGDSFDIKQATTAETIDDTNDTIIASFGREITVGSRAPAGAVGQYSQVYGMNCTASGYNAHAEGSMSIASGESAHAEGEGVRASGMYSHAEGESSQASGHYSHAEGWESHANGMCSHAQNSYTIADSQDQTAIGRYNIADDNGVYALIIGNGDGMTRHDALRVKWDGSVIDGSGNKISPTILTSSTISASDTSYTFTDDAITTDSVIDVYDSIFGFSPTGITVSTGSCTITFAAQSSTHQIKLFLY